MPDISMCSGANCPKREDCYRFKAKPDRMQSYFVTPPVDALGECRHLMPLYPDERKR